MPALRPPAHRKLAQIIAYAMLWSCFPTPTGSPNGDPTASSHTQSDHQPRKIGPLFAPWDLVQRPAAAEIATQHEDSASCPPPSEVSTAVSLLRKLTRKQEIIRVTGATPCYNGEEYQQKNVVYTTLVAGPRGTTSQNCSYDQLQSRPDGREALTRFQTTFNRTRPLPKDLPPETGGLRWDWIKSWFRSPRKKRRQRVVLLT
jgi:hypothetical protein